MNASLLTRILPVLQATPGVAAVSLGGSRGRGTATETSDYDIGLYYHRDEPIDVDSLGAGIGDLVDAPPILTRTGEWGPWIVGGGWLRIGGQKVDLLYRSLEEVSEVISECARGKIRIDYQPGHPHGFCSAIWAGEVALCKPLHDPQGKLSALKSATASYPEALRAALLKRFFWEVLFSIENAELGANREDETHVCGSAYRAFACLGQTLFAINRRWLINEKAALAEAAAFPVTIPRLRERTRLIWRALANGEFSAGLSELRLIEEEMRPMVQR